MDLFLGKFPETLAGHAFSLKGEYFMADTAQSNDSRDLAPHEADPSLDLSREIISDIAEAEAERFKRLNVSMSFDEYLQRFFERPELEPRNGAAYEQDAWRSTLITEDHLYHGRKIARYAAVDFPWQPEGSDIPLQLCGADEAVHNHVQFLESQSKEVVPRWLLVEFGPSGCGKSLFQMCRKQLLEDYSKNHEEGVLLRAYWEFGKGAPRELIGYAAENSDKAEVSQEGGVIRIVPTENTKPYTIIPRPIREKIVEKLRARGKLTERFNVDKFLSDELDDTSQDIYEALKRHYDGDFMKIAQNHLRIERWEMSSKHKRGIVNILPDSDPYSEVAPLMPRSPFETKEMPDELSSVDSDTSTVRSRLLRGNHGMVHFEDGLRQVLGEGDPRQVARFNYMLQFFEDRVFQAASRQNPAELREVVVDTVLSLNTNPEQILQRMQSPGFEPIRQKAVFMNHAATRDFLEEARAHGGLLNQRLSRDEFNAPHALNSLALFAVSTRLLNPQPEYYRGLGDKNNPMSEIIEGMSTVEKALVLQGVSKDNPLQDLNFGRGSRKAWTQRQLKKLTEPETVAAIDREHRQSVGETEFFLYDGGVGLQTREVRKLVERLIPDGGDKPFTAMMVFEALEKRLEAGFAFDKTSREFKAAKIAEGVKQQMGQAQFSEQRVNEKAVAESVNREVEASFPIPDTKRVFEEARKYAQYKVRLDVNTALELSDPEDATRKVKRYIHHVNALLNQTDVKNPEYQVPNGRTKPNVQTVLEDFEDQMQKAGVLKAASREEYRQRILTRVTNWATSPDVDVEDKRKGVDGMEIETDFSDLIKGVKSAQRGDIKDTVKTFLKNCERYDKDESLMEKDKQNPMKRKATELYERAVKKFHELGYPEGTISSHVAWVYP